MAFYETYDDADMSRTMMGFVKMVGRCLYYPIFCGAIVISGADTLFFSPSSRLHHTPMAAGR